MKKRQPDVEKFDQRLTKVYSTDVNKEQQYDEWAADYESDLVNDLEYVAHKEASDIFVDYVTDKNSRVLDVACGTGLVGEYLKCQKYKYVEGVDFSKEMIVIAKARNVYQHLWQHDFTGAAEVKNLYDSLICVGMFSFTIPKINHMHHVVNCVEPGGCCIITVNGAAWEQLNLEPEVIQEAKDHQFSIEHIIETQYIKKEGITAQVLVIKR